MLTEIQRKRFRTKKELAARATTPRRHAQAGETWVHRKTGRLVRVLSADVVAILYQHESGRVSSHEHDDFEEMYKRSSGESGRLFDHRAEMTAR